MSQRAMVTKCLFLFCGAHGSNVLLRKTTKLFSLGFLSNKNPILVELNMVSHYTIRFWDRRKALLNEVMNLWPIPVAAPPKVWVCGISLAGIVGSNPAGGMDYYLL
jgi:hypothetical protein